MSAEKGKYKSDRDKFLKSAKRFSLQVDETGSEVLFYDPAKKNKVATIEAGSEYWALAAFVRGTCGIISEYSSNAMAVTKHTASVAWR